MLTETRAGAVDAAAAELERIERDLHDGAQARLVALAMDLGMAEERFERDPDGARELRREGARRGQAGARRAARPRPRHAARRCSPTAACAEAIRALAARTPAADDGDGRARRPGRARPSSRRPTSSSPRRWRTRSSTAARRALTVDVDAATGTCSSSQVADDGDGGADPDGGGLTGLRKRVEALDGTLRDREPAGGPTLLRAEMPCGS